MTKRKRKLVNWKTKLNELPTMQQRKTTKWKVGEMG